MIDVEKQRARWKRAQQAARDRGTASKRGPGRPPAAPPPASVDWQSFPAWVEPRRPKGLA